MKVYKKSWDRLAREMVQKEIEDKVCEPMNVIDFEIAVMLKASWLKQWGTEPKRRAQHWP